MDFCLNLEIFVCINKLLNKFLCGQAYCICESVHFSVEIDLGGESSGGAGMGDCSLSGVHQVPGRVTHRIFGLEISSAAFQIIRKLCPVSRVVSRTTLGLRLVKRPFQRWWKAPERSGVPSSTGQGATSTPIHPTTLRNQVLHLHHKKV